MKSFSLSTGLIAAALMAVPCLASAQTYTTITQWNFNSPAPDATVSTGTNSPSTGTGTLALIGGVTSTYNTGSPGDAVGTTNADNSGLQTTSYPAQGAATGTAGVQFNVSTATFKGAIQISFDLRESATASRYFQLQLSTDGTTFVNAAGGTGAFTLSPSPNSNTSFDNNGLYSDTSGSGSQAYVQGISYTLPANSAYANDANFAFRLVAVYDTGNPGNYTASNDPTSTYATTGNARFDLVTVAAAPEPSTWTMMGLGLCGFFTLRRVIHPRI